jgi:uncharacterized protein (DUF58 family)
VLGLPFGALHSVRRGLGSDVAGTRPYQPGDDVDRIDWYASARLSLARGSDEFIVREHFAEEAPRVVCLCDRRPSMGLVPSDWPWLQKPAAIDHAVRLIADSAIAARGLLGYYDEAGGEPVWHPPRSQHVLAELSDDPRFGAPEDTLVRGLTHLARQRRDLPGGTFVFVVSDFLECPTRDEWLQALERRFEVVPVIVQDPVWEQSFPDVSGVTVPFLDPVERRARLVAFSEDEAAERRAANEQRFAGLVKGFHALDMDPVVVSSHEHRDVVFSFLAWADERVLTRGRR